MKLNKLTQHTALAIVLAGSTSYAASSDALLKLLVSKGVISEAEASAVAAELVEQEQVAIQETVATAVTEELQKQDSGIAFTAKGNETVKVTFNGRMHFQYDGLSMNDNGVDLDDTNHFYFRRLYLGAKATHKNGLFAETVLNFAEDGLAIDKAVAGFEFDDALTASVGYEKVPFGFQETTSSSKIKTIERSAANRFFADDIDFSGRHAGIHAKGDLPAGFSYAAAVVNSVQGEGSRLMGASNTSNDLAYFGRVQWSNENITVGVDAGHQTNNYVNGTATPFDVTAFTGYANVKYKGFDLLGEYFNADLGNMDDAEGYAIRAAYKIQKFEPVFRFSHAQADTFVIDTDELIRRAPNGGTVTGGDNEIDSYYFGVNYYHNKSVSFMVGYEIADTDSNTNDNVDVDGARARLQILW